MLTGLPPTRLASLPPPLRASVAADPGGVARRVLLLKAALPGADVAGLISRAPALALDPAACAAASAAAPTARALLQGGLGADSGSGGDGDGDGSSSSSVDALIAAQPLLLTEDLEAVVAEIRRCVDRLSKQGEARAACHCFMPFFFLSSQWCASLKPALPEKQHRLLPGQHPGDVIRRHPQLLLKLQRGSASLGPGAEECLDV